MNQREPKPNYLPQFVHGEKPLISEQTIGILAFVLSGIDPSETETKTQGPEGHCSLREFVADPSVKRIGPGSAMRHDYQYVLAPQFDFDQVDFEDIWLDAKQVPSGQGATEFLKLAKQVRHLKVDEDVDVLSSKNAELIEQVRQHSHRLLHRIHRTAIRHIEESLKTHSEPQRRSWHTWLLGRFGLSKDTYIATFRIEEDIRRDVVRYVKDVVKIGCLLRSNVRRG